MSENLPKFHFEYTEETAPEPDESGEEYSILQEKESKRHRAAKRLMGAAALGGRGVKRLREHASTLRTKTHERVIPEEPTDNPRDFYDEQSDADYLEDPDELEGVDWRLAEEDLPEDDPHLGDFDDVYTERDPSLITDDIEILGQSKHLRRQLRGTTRDTANAIHEGYIGGRKLVGTPRTEYVRWRGERTALKAARLERKLEGLPDTRRNRARREKVKILKNREKWRKDQVLNRGKKHLKRVEKFTGSASAGTEGKKQQREERYQQRIDELVHKKIKAAREKQYKKLLKEAGFNKLQARKRMQHRKGLTWAEKQQITMDAIEAVRRKNVQKGILDVDYSVYDDPTKREVDNYERVVR